MPKTTRFQLETPIDEVMRICPATINVMISRNLHCIGCVLACFHTVQDVAHEHDQQPDRLLDALNEAARESSV